MTVPLGPVVGPFGQVVGSFGPVEDPLVLAVRNRGDPLV